MSKPRSLNHLIIKRAWFIKNCMEVFYVTEGMQIDIKLNLECGSLDQEISNDDVSRKIFIRAIVEGKEKQDPKEKGSKSEPINVFLYEGILVCEAERLLKSRSKKSIDELFEENIWHYGPMLYQIIRSRMIQNLREHGINFPPPIDLAGHGIEFTYSGAANNN